MTLAETLLDILLRLKLAFPYSDDLFLSELDTYSFVPGWAFDQIVKGYNLKNNKMLPFSFPVPYSCLEKNWWLSERGSEGTECWWVRKKMVCVIKLGLMNFLTENTIKKKYFYAVLTCLGQKNWTDFFPSALSMANIYSLFIKHFFSSFSWIKRDNIRWIMK